jgi:hypothetical protein
MPMFLQAHGLGFFPRALKISGDDEDLVGGD